MLLNKGQVRIVIYNDKEINDETEINNYIYSFLQRRIIIF